MKMSKKIAHPVVFINQKVGDYNHHTPQKPQCFPESFTHNI